MSVFVLSPKRRNEDPKKISPRRKSLDAELTGLGHMRKQLQPPGGVTHGVFDAYTLPPEVLTPRKKVNDYLKSEIFEKDKPSLPRPVIPANETTHHHLFAALPPTETPTKCRNRMKSTIFDPDPPKDPITKCRNRMKSTVFDPDPPNKPPREFVKKNPITGEFCDTSVQRNEQKREIRNPITFEGVKERSIRSRCTQPPGGKSTFVLEYIE